MEKLEIVWSILGAIGVVVLGLIAKGLAKLISTVLENTIELRVLSNEMKGMKETILEIPKIKKDVSAAHEKLRNLNGGSK